MEDHYFQTLAQQFLTLIPLSDDVEEEDAFAEAAQSSLSTLLQEGFDVSRIIDTDTIGFHRLLHLGLNPNHIVDEEMLTTLFMHVVALGDCVDTASLMLHFGADIEAVNIFGNRPLHIICSHDGDLFVLRRILEAGAEVESRQSVSMLHSSPTFPYFTC